MNVHFLSAIHDVQNDCCQSCVFDAVRKCGDGFSNDKLLCNKTQCQNWQEIYKSNIEALTRADVVITDVTSSNFAISYMAAISLQYKKPTLILFRDNAVDGVAALGLSDPLATVKEYNFDNLEKIVTDFLEINRIDVKDMRFNFFIDRQIYNYLRWASHKSGKTKAEVLRELVCREIERINADEST